MDKCYRALNTALYYAKDAPTPSSYMSLMESYLKDSFLSSKILKSAKNYYTCINKGIEASIEDESN